MGMYNVGEPDVAIVGCSNGDDFEVVRDRVGASVVVRAGDRTWGVGGAEWRAAVFGFADQVEAFYRASTPKRPAAEDESGFQLFLAEWHRRRHDSA